uniref:Reverse transcriptase domain-containing protein n=1 Tax=Callorhinchus milii TaxID=7868 RepID=A0A4W3GIG5_CALMI
MLPGLRIKQKCDAVPKWLCVHSIIYFLASLFLPKPKNPFVNAKLANSNSAPSIRTPHSTETALVRVTNDILNICDQGSLCLLVPLDLSATFDTVDYSILIHRLAALLNLRGSALAWFDSYLSHRLYFIASNGFSSPRTVMSGFPQGSVLGPLLFNIYMLTLGDIIRRHGVNFHMYADDAQLYLSASPLNSRTTAVLTECLSDIKSWMRANFLQLNVNKTEPLQIGSRQRLSTSGCGSISLHGCTLQLTKPVRNPGVLFNTPLSSSPHSSHDPNPNPSLTSVTSPDSATTSPLRPLKHLFMTPGSTMQTLCLSAFPTP